MSVVVAQVVDAGLDGLTLDQLAGVARQEHREVERSVKDALRHAVACGDAMNRAIAMIPPGEGRHAWMESLDISTTAAYVYRRLARERDKIGDAQSVAQANRMLRGAEDPGVGMRDQWRSPHRPVAISMYEDGASVAAIARALDLHPTRVSEYIRLRDPEQLEAFRAKRREYHRQRRARLRAAKAGLDRQREREIARKAGGGIAELYAAAERLQDIIGRAHGEATDSEAREALAKAGVHYRRMRDEIVRALGVS